MSVIHIFELDTVVVSAEPSQSLIYDVVSVGIAIFTVSFMERKQGNYTVVFIGRIKIRMYFLAI